MCGWVGNLVIVWLWVFSVLLVFSVFSCLSSLWVWVQVVVGGVLSQVSFFGVMFQCVSCRVSLVRLVWRIFVVLQVGNCLCWFFDYKWQYMFGFRCFVWLVCWVVEVWEMCWVFRWVMLLFGLKCGICVRLVLIIICMLLMVRLVLVMLVVSIILCVFCNVGLMVVCWVVRLSLLCSGQSSILG